MGLNNIPSCQECGNVISDGFGCNDATLSKGFGNAKKQDARVAWTPVVPGTPCPDCNVGDGGIHHQGCLSEVCPFCGEHLWDNDSCKCTVRFVFANHAQAKLQIKAKRVSVPQGDMSKDDEVELLRAIQKAMPEGSYLSRLFTDSFADWVQVQIRADVLPDMETALCDLMRREGDLTETIRVQDERIREGGNQFNKFASRVSISVWHACNVLGVDVDSKLKWDEYLVKLVDEIRNERQLAETSMLNAVNDAYDMGDVARAALDNLGIYDTPEMSTVERIKALEQHASEQADEIDRLTTKVDDYESGNSVSVKAIDAKLDELLSAVKAQA